MPHPDHFTPRKYPVPLVQEAGWALRPVWTGAENLASTGIRSPDCPARSKSLYWLSYPGPREADSFWANQKQTRNFTTVSTAVHFLSLSKSKLILSTPPGIKFLNIHSNITFLYTRRCSKFSHHFWFPYQNPLWTSHVSHTCYMPQASHCPWFDQRNIVC